MFEIEKIHPKIFVFKNTFENSYNLVNHFSSPFYSWEPWYTFGSQLNLSNKTVNFNEFPSNAEWKEKTEILGQYEMADFLNNFIKKNIQNNKSFGLCEKDLLFLEQGSKYIKDILHLFYKTTEIYFKENSLDKKDLLFNSFNIAKYFPDSGVSENMSMNYHTDFRQERVNFVDHNFYVTCLFYLNDEYEGGEISFKILDDNQTNIKFSVDYKPNAGDIIVFPSTPPFYHGVKKSKQKEKYIIRTYWKTTYETNLNFNEENYQKSFEIKENDDTYYFQGLRDLI